MAPSQAEVEIRQWSYKKQADTRAAPHHGTSEGAFADR